MSYQFPDAQRLPINENTDRDQCRARVRPAANSFGKISNASKFH